MPSPAADHLVRSTPTSITRNMRDIMDRRELLGVLGAGAAGLVALRGGEARADREAPHFDHIETLGECAKACGEAAQHCLDELRKGGKHAEDHARAHEALMDCHAFCVLAATLMARRSPMAKYAHQGAVAACRTCASACEGYPGDLMEECVTLCRVCEKMCRQIVVSAR